MVPATMRIPDHGSRGQAPSLSEGRVEERLRHGLSEGQYEPLGQSFFGITKTCPAHTP